MIGIVPPPAGRGRATVAERFCAGLCGIVRPARLAPMEPGVTMPDAGQAAFGRAEPADRGHHSRGDRPAPDLPAIAGRAGQAQPVDAGEGAGRPPPVHARHHRCGWSRRWASPCARAPDAPVPPPAGNGDVAPDSLGAYSRRAVTWHRGDATSRCGRRSATRTRSSPTAPRSSGSRRRRRWCFARASGMDAAFSPVRRGRGAEPVAATSISSPTGTASIA